MKGRYLEVTFRRGRPLAAYLYLPRTDGAKSSRTQRMDGGVIVDFGPDGAPIGLEITDPCSTTAAMINSVLDGLGAERVGADELRPLRAA